MTSCPTATCLSLHASSLGSRKSGGLMRAFLHFRDSVLDPLAGFLDAFGFCPPELPDAFALGLLMPAPPEGFDAVDGADESAELLLSCPMGFALVVADGRLLPTASVSLGVLVLEIRLLLPSSVLEGLFGGTEETATGETGEGGCKCVPDLMLPSDVLELVRGGDGKAPAGEPAGEADCECVLDLVDCCCA
mmetsp:Transcript_1623/g.2974  ORF Transcript_1623/g.2974 Transcript_1623/m.2974 type:complete len:191 (-) Transcript_1623:299-871(-)